MTDLKLEAAAHAEGLEVYTEGDDVLVLKPSHAGVLREARAETNTTAAIVVDALTILGRLNARRLEELAAPRRTLAELRVAVRLELEEQIGGLRALETSDDDEVGWGPHVTGIRELASTHNLLATAERLELELGDAPVAGADEVLDVVYRVLSALPGLESATDVADTVDARVREELDR